MRDLKLIFAASFLLLCNCAHAQQPTPDAGAGVPSTQAKPQPTPPAQKPADANPAGTTSDPTVKKPAPKKKVAQKPAPKPAAATTTAAPAPAASPAPDSATAKEKEDLEHLRSTTLNLIRLLVQEGILTQDKADQLVRDAERAAITPPTIVQRESTPSTGAGAAVGVAAGAAAGVAAGGTATTSAATASAEQTASAEGAKVAADATQPPAAGAKVQRVPYVPEIVRNEIREQVREDVIAQAKSEGWATPNAVPEWVDRISFEGDLRLRYQDNLYGAQNPPAAVYNSITGSNQLNTSQNEEWFRLRARLGLIARVTDSLTAKISVSTGNAQNPVSLNQNWANYFSGFSVQLDNAYVRYAPSERFSATAGRMPKPFFSSEMVWWEDLVFDGVAATGSVPLGQRTTGFVTGGAFLIQSQNSTPITPDPKTKSLLGLQVGADTLLDKSTRLKVALAYYGYQNIQGQPNTIDAPNANDWTVPGYTQKGNSLFDINAGTGSAPLYALASNFKEINLTAALDLLQFDPYLIRISGDYVKNIGFNQAQILALTGQSLPKQTAGYQMGIQVGRAQVKELNDWQVFFTYRYLPGNATLDAFNDPDFHLGGTNAKGYILGLTYGLAKNTWLRARWMSADEIDGPPLAIDVFQFDFNVRF